MTQNNSIIPMSLERAQELAPAAFATKPADRLTKIYNFTPTTELISHMDSLGFQLTNAKQSKSKNANPLYTQYGTHILEFQNEQLYMKDERGNIEGRPTIVLINNHNGDRPLQFEMGLFRLVCSNGLVIKTQDFGGMKERHTKYNLDQVKEIVSEKTSAMEKAITRINRWTGIEMTERQRFQFATEALALRLADDRTPEQYEIIDLLQPRRKEDNGKSLWLTYNVVQEGLIKGGFSLNNREARAIKNPMADFKINQDLWALAEKYELVS